jgi:Insulin-like growth factor binding protein
MPIGPGRPTSAVFFAVFALIVAGGSQPAEALVCTGCTADDRSDCPSVADCRGGRVPDACDCCLECARVEDETCGGRYRTEGRCDEGLMCVITPMPGAVITGEEIGTCRGERNCFSIFRR